MRGISAVFLACAIASCGGASDGITGGGGSSGTIDVADNEYRPANDTVTAGTTVTWRWVGSTVHSVTFEGGPTSANMVSGSYTRSFESTGTYAYHCSVHGASMSGTVTVR